MSSVLECPLILTKTGSASAAAVFTNSNAITRGYVLGGNGLISDTTARWVFHMADTDSIEVR